MTLNEEVIRLKEQVGQVLLWKKELESELDERNAELKTLRRMAASHEKKLATLSPLEGYAKEIARMTDAIDRLASTVTTQGGHLRVFEQAMGVHASNHTLLIELYQKHK